jgi:hypothetical protein
MTDRTRASGWRPTTATEYLPPLIEIEDLEERLRVAREVAADFDAADFDRRQADLLAAEDHLLRARLLDECDDPCADGEAPSSVIARLRRDLARASVEADALRDARGAALRALLALASEDVIWSYAEASEALGAALGLAEPPSREEAARLIDELDPHPPTPGVPRG